MNHTAMCLQFLTELDKVLLIVMEVHLQLKPNLCSSVVYSLTQHIKSLTTQDALVDLLTLNGKLMMK